MRKLCIVAVAICALLTMACSSSRPATESMSNPLGELPIASGDALVSIRIESVEDLENYADAILTGTLRNDGKEVVSAGDMGHPLGYTIYTLDVAKVFRGDFEVGDTLPIAEPYFVRHESDGEAYLSTIDGYAPSMIGVEYLFFLDYDDREYDGLENISYGTYSPVLLNKGRYLYLTPEELVEKERLQEAEEEAALRKEVEKSVMDSLSSTEKVSQEEIDQRIDQRVAELQATLREIEELEKMERTRMGFDTPLEEQVVDAYMSVTPTQP